MRRNGDFLGKLGGMSIGLKYYINCAEFKSLESFGSTVEEFHGVGKGLVTL